MEALNLLKAQLSEAVGSVQEAMAHLPTTPETEVGEMFTVIFLGQPVMTGGMVSEAQVVLRDTVMTNEHLEEFPFASVAMYRIEFCP